MKSQPSTHSSRILLDTKRASSLKALRFGKLTLETLQLILQWITRNWNVTRGSTVVVWIWLKSKIAWILSLKITLWSPYQINAFTYTNFCQGMGVIITFLIESNLRRPPSVLERPLKQFLAKRPKLRQLKHSMSCTSWDVLLVRVITKKKKSVFYKIWKTNAPNMFLKRFKPSRTSLVILDQFLWCRH